METIGSKRSYALIWCMPNNDDDDDARKHIVSLIYTAHSKDNDAILT